MQLPPELAGTDAISLAKEPGEIESIRAPRHFGHLKNSEVPVRQQLRATLEPQAHRIFTWRHAELAGKG